MPKRRANAYLSSLVSIGVELLYSHDGSEPAIPRPHVKRHKRSSMPSSRQSRNELMT